MPRHTKMTKELHSAGATVLHSSPFDDLQVPTSHDSLTQSFIARWVQPFYFKVPDEIGGCESELKTRMSELTPEVIAKLLCEFNWRPRIVGGLLVALCKSEEFEEQIGRLLLRSDVCFAAYGYCLALARLNSERSINFICEYLDYYLTRPDLRFDQDVAMAALQTLDNQNGTEYAPRFIERWNLLVSDKPVWGSLTYNCHLFSGALQSVAKLANRLKLD